MNINQLKYFHKLVELKSFSQTAEFFSVSQPTITEAIQKLEKRNHTTFFKRNHAHQELTLTLDGKQFDLHVAYMLHEMKLAQNDLIANHNKYIRLGLPPIISSYYFPRVSKQLVKAGLLSKLQTIQEGSQSLLRLLIDGEIDIALLGSIEPLDRRDLNAITFAHFPIGIIVPSTHPLASKKMVKFIDIAKENFIMPGKSFVHNRAFNYLSRQNHVHPKVIFRTDNIKMIKEMVNSNIGIGFLTTLAIDKRDNLDTLLLSDDDVPNFNLSIAYRKRHLLTIEEEKLLTILQKSYLST